jgi:hypothetical protein
MGYSIRVDFISYTGGIADGPTFKVRGKYSMQILEYGDWEVDYLEEIINDSEYTITLVSIGYNIPIDEMKKVKAFCASNGIEYVCTAG